MQRAQVAPPRLRDPSARTTGSKHLPSIPSLGPGGHLALGEGETQVAPHCPTRAPRWPAPRAAPPYPASRSGEFHTSASLLQPREPVCQQPCRGVLPPGRTPAAVPGAPAALGLFSQSPSVFLGASYPQCSHPGRAHAGRAPSTAPSLPRRHSPLSAQVPASRSPRPRASRTFLRADILGLS